jgi:hypothetical protein
MKTRLITSASGVLLATSLVTAGDAPKLVPRPVPGLFDALHKEKAQNEEALSMLDAALANKSLPPPHVPVTDAGADSGKDAESAPAPASTSAKAYVPEKPAAAAADTTTRARILFIHRRATLPTAMTADLAKPVTPKEGGSKSAQISPVRPGKIRIIPKSEVASLLAPAPAPKPSAP